MFVPTGSPSVNYPEQIMRSIHDAHQKRITGVIMRITNVSQRLQYKWGICLIRACEKIVYSAGITIVWPVPGLVLLLIDIERETRNCSDEQVIGAKVQFTLRYAIGRLLRGQPPDCMNLMPSLVDTLKFPVRYLFYLLAQGLRYRCCLWERFVRFTSSENSMYYPGLFVGSRLLPGEQVYRQADIH